MMCDRTVIGRFLVGNPVGVFVSFFFPVWFDLMLLLLVLPSFPLPAPSLVVVKKEGVTKAFVRRF